LLVVSLLMVLLGVDPQQNLHAQQVGGGVGNGGGECVQQRGVREMQQAASSSQ
jgi:hypothetical protein